jgi:hypothetical protein
MVQKGAIHQVEEEWHNIKQRIIEENEMIGEKKKTEK